MRNMCCTSSHHHRASSLSRESKRGKFLNEPNLKLCALLTTKFSVFKKVKLNIRAVHCVCVCERESWMHFCRLFLVKVKTDFPQMKMKIFLSFTSAVPKCVFLVYTCANMRFFRDFCSIFESRQFSFVNNFHADCEI